MKTLAILLAVLAATTAKPFIYGHPGFQPLSYPYFRYGAYPYAAYPYSTPVTKVVKSAELKSIATPFTVPLAPAYTASQYHSQDEIGQASYGYAHPGQSHAATRDAFGNVVGSYAYINPDGKEVRVNYVADSNGFRVASNDLPVAPTAPVFEVPAEPTPVEDTPEVKAAKAEHFAAVEAAKARNAETEEEQTSNRRKRSVILTSPVQHINPFSYSYAYTSPSVYRSPLAYAAQVPYTAPVAYVAPTAYAAPIAYAKPTTYTAPVAYAAPALPVQPVREATLTKTVLNPGHAVSYRVD
ncbi:hypothetical protein QYM36_000136 [Artemia franciscana]|nr:hypothetical protein QYM36_000136 [Artemia franciscana]